MLSPGIPNSVPQNTYNVVITYPTLPRMFITSLVLAVVPTWPSPQSSVQVYSTWTSGSSPTQKLQEHPVFELSSTFSFMVLSVLTKISLRNPHTKSGHWLPLWRPGFIFSVSLLQHCVFCIVASTSIRMVNDNKSGKEFMIYIWKHSQYVDTCNQTFNFIYI